MHKRKIFIVDDHPIMRQGLSQLINHEPDLRVVGEAADATTGLAGMIESSPDLVIADITLPGKNGLEFIKSVRALQNNVAILVHSMHDESIYLERVLRAGAQGYVMKDEGGKCMMEAIRKVLAGEIYVSAAMGAKIIETFSSRKAGSFDPIESLSDRQFEVFRMIGNGKETRTIAKELSVSVKTVDAHRANIKEKLGLRSGNELVRAAVRWLENQQNA